MSSEMISRMTAARRTIIGLTGGACLLFAASCRKEEPRKAVSVAEDGQLRLTLATFNIRYEGNGDQGWRAWPNRIGRVTKTIRGMNADVMGLQEALHGQCADLQASLPDYGFHGVGRDDGKRQGEYAAIFYRRDRFERDITDQGTFWLSDYPDKPGSMTWGVRKASTFSTRTGTTATSLPARRRRC